LAAVVRIIVYKVKMNTNLLITTSLDPPKSTPYLKMLGEAKRTLTSKAALYFWASIGVDKIIIADCNGKALLDINEISLIKELGIEIEQISYLQDNKVVEEKGKGYGEGALIDFALNNSELLRNEEYFYKCTGKLYCHNFTNIHKIISENKIKTILWNNENDSTNQVDTRFFYTNHNFCKKYLIPAYKNVNDRQDKWAEHCCYEFANKTLFPAITQKPIICGFSGTFNTHYKHSFDNKENGSFKCWVQT